MEYKFLNKTDEIWKTLKKRLPKDNNDKEEEKLLLINAVLYLLEKIKGRYSLQLKWNSLESNEFKNLFKKDKDLKYVENINIDSLRQKFDRWRNAGVWEDLLPLFNQEREYRWITAPGTYEVLLRCSKWVRDKSLNHKKYIKMQNQIHADKLDSIKKRHIEELEELEKLINEKNSTVKQLEIEINALKHGAETKKLNAEILILTNERNIYSLKNDELIKLNRKYIFTLYKNYGYNPAESKRPNMDVINNFREVLGTSFNEEDILD